MLIREEMNLEGTKKQHNMHLDHATDKVVDLVLTVAGIATHNETVTLLDKTTARGVELEGPEEGVGLLEVRANSVDLVDKVLHADDAVLAKSALDDLVGGKRDALAGDLAETTLVDELADALEVGIAVGDEGLDKTEHHDGGLVETDKDTVEDLTQTEETEDLACAGRDTVDTADANNKGKLGLRLAVEAALVASSATEGHKVLLCSTVLSKILLGTGVVLVTLGNGSLLSSLCACSLLRRNRLIVNLLLLCTLRSLGLAGHHDNNESKRKRKEG